MGLPPKEWPMCTRRYAATSATGAISLTGSHNRMAAQEPGRRRPVKAASRRSRSRTARALTGLRRSGRGAPSGYGGVWTRGAQSLECSTCCANWHTVMLSCTLCQASDLFVLFCRPTAPHLAPFILPSLGWQSASRRPCAILRQTAIGHDSDPASRQQVLCAFIAVDVLNLW